MHVYTAYRDAVEHTAERRRDFFKLVFGNETGYVCIAYKAHLDKSMNESYFVYPAQLDQLCAEIETAATTLTHVYFCPQLLKSRNRSKDNVSKCTVLWADLDSCNPQLLQVPASIVVQTSAGRWQALWRLETAIEPLEAEQLSRRIAYFHFDQGADKSGWDLTQLLRVPYTPNYKYGDAETAPIVVVTSTNTSLYRKSDFDVYPEYEALKFTNDPIPVRGNLPDESGIDVLQRYRTTLNPAAFGLVSLDPDTKDWSRQQWRLINLCVEAGLSREETFLVLKEAKCNKYARDGRPDSALWIEINKAYVVHLEDHGMVQTPSAVVPHLITDEEVRRVQGSETFVERYINWASSLTDAAPQYHQASAFTILSALISGSVVLPTSFGNIRPNMWFMLLADTTLTRKSTAMDIGMDTLYEIFPDALLANDGSPEGIMSALQNRPMMPSIYLRDEFTGLIEQMSNKDYMAGMAEHFTKLYDGKTLKRLLRKEEIMVKDPILIIYAGGVKTKTKNILTEEHISSGFIPRFVFITAVADPTRVRPVGPPLRVNKEEKDKIKTELFDIYDFYNRDRLIIMPNGQTKAHIKPAFEAVMTTEAWDRYNQLETTLTNAALETGLDHLTPMHDRLAKSILKAAILIAASRQRDDAMVVIEVEDIIHAIYYGRRWQEYANDVVQGVGKSQDERMIDQIVDFVYKGGKLGISRSEIMKHFRLDAKRTELLMTTILQRRILVAGQFGGQPRYIGNK